MRSRSTMSKLVAGVGYVAAVVQSVTAQRTAAERTRLSCLVSRLATRHSSVEQGIERPRVSEQNDEWVSSDVG